MFAGEIVVGSDNSPLKERILLAHHLFLSVAISFHLFSLQNGQYLNDFTRNIKLGGSTSVL